MDDSPVVGGLLCFPPRLVRSCLGGGVLWSGEGFPGYFRISSRSADPLAPTSFAYCNFLYYTYTPNITCWKLFKAPHSYCTTELYTNPSVLLCRPSQLACMHEYSSVLPSVPLPSTLNPKTLNPPPPPPQPPPHFDFS